MFKLKIKNILIKPITKFVMGSMIIGLTTGLVILVSASPEGSTFLARIGLGLCNNDPDLLAAGIKYSNIIGDKFPMLKPTIKKIVYSLPVVHVDPVVIKKIEILQKDFNQLSSFYYETRQELDNIKIQVVLLENENQRLNNLIDQYQLEDISKKK